MRPGLFGNGEVCLWVNQGGEVMNANRLEIEYKGLSDKVNYKGQIYSRLADVAWNEQRHHSEVINEYRRKQYAEQMIRIPVPPPLMLMDYDTTATASNYFRTVTTATTGHTLDETTLRDYGVITNVIS